jgi:hypothetical protein
MTLTVRRPTEPESRTVSVRGIPMSDISPSTRNPLSGG